MGKLRECPRWMPLIKRVKRLRGDEELWYWTFGLEFPLLVDWTTRITQSIPLQLIAWELVFGVSNQGSAEFFPTESRVPFMSNPCF